jgi:hypothetical protein
MSVLMGKATESMKTGQKQQLIFKQTVVAMIGWAAAASLVVNASANSTPIPVTVTETTDWGTTPMEIVTADLPYSGYDGGVYAGINTLSVTQNGTSTTYSGFCIDPFHWSLGGAQSGYEEVSLANAPKSPAPLNAATATDIGDLWAEYYSPTMSSSSAAGLQIAIWELVSTNAVANDGLSPSYAFSLAPGQSDYGASQDIASLATYNGPSANLIGLTGPGQDYVIDPVPDSGGTFLMLALTLGALVLARPAILNSMDQQRKAQAIQVK